MVKKSLISRGANRIHCLLASILMDAWRLSSELRVLSTSHHQSNRPQFTESEGRHSGTRMSLWVLVVNITYSFCNVNFQMLQLGANSTTLNMLQWITISFNTKSFIKKKNVVITMVLEHKMLQSYNSHWLEIVWLSFYWRLLSMYASLKEGEIHS